MNVLQICSRGKRQSESKVLCNVAMNENPAELCSIAISLSEGTGFTLLDLPGHVSGRVPLQQTWMTEER